MSIGPEDIKKIAHLARLQVSENEAEKLCHDIGNILNLVDQLQNANTTDIEPMANPLDAVQVLRSDKVTETNQRDALQTVAPLVEKGLYLVPKVIE
ncbi:MAG: Asp-tRNA(Asn)/Glu-tRNA(Gln) amidotransferase subunit GatC [Oleiphilus sp.]